MTDEQPDGLLSQEDINAALAAAGLDTGAIESSSDSSTQTEGVDSSEPVQSEQQQAPRLDSAGRPFDEMAEAMAAAIESEANIAPEPDQAQPDVEQAGAREFSIPELDSNSQITAGSPQAIDMLRDVELNVKIELGRSRMLVDDVLRLGSGSVVELDKLAGDPVDVFVNNRLVARGEVLVLNDNFCVRINEIVSREIEDEEKS